MFYLPKDLVKYLILIYLFRVPKKPSKNPVFFTNTLSFSSVFSNIFFSMIS